MGRGLQVLWWFLAGVVLALSGCSVEPPEPMRIGTNVWPGYEPLYLARDLGMFDDREIRLVEHGSASQVIRAYRNHVLDAAALTLDEVLLLAEDGLDPRVVLVMDISHGGDMVIGRAGIENMAGLKGKRVGFENSALGAYVLARALELSGMNLQDVEPVAIEVDEHEKAFADGEVDGVVTFDPVGSRLLAAGGSLLFDSSRIPGEVVDVLVVRGTYLDSHRQQVAALIDQWFAAIDHLDRQPRDAARRMGKRLRQSPEEVLVSYEGLRLPDRDRNRALLMGGEDGPGLLAAARRLEGVMIEAGLLERRVPLDGLFVSGAVVGN